MTECPNCGAPVLSTHRFCQYCGTELHPEVAESIVTPEAEETDVLEGNSVMRVSLGTCTRSRAAQIIRELCGYSLDDATAIAAPTPTTVAQALTDQQTVCLAQALTEYGMEVSIYDKNGYRTPVPEQETVFSSGGGLLSTVLGVLGGIGVANRLTRSLIRRQSYPHPYTGSRPPIFRPLQ